MTDLQRWGYSEIAKEVARCYRSEQKGVRYYHGVLEGLYYALMYGFAPEWLSDWAGKMWLVKKDTLKL